MHKFRKMLAASAAAVMTLTSAAGALTMISAAAAEPSISMGVIAGGANIGVNIYIDLNDISQYDITLDGEAVVVTETDTGCKFSIEAAAKDMAKKHTVSVANKSVSTDKKEAEFTIDDYLLKIAEKDGAYKELTDAMRAYGHAAGDLFKTNASEINATLSAAQAETAEGKINSYEKSFSTADYNTTLKNKKAPVTYEGMNLSLRSETVLSLFYLPAEGSDMDAALEYLKGFTGCDTVQKQDVDGTEYISQSVSVPAAKMFDKFTLKKGSDFETKPFGALDYMKTVVSGSYDATLKNVCLTLCNYADAVKNFKEPSGTIRADSFEPRSGRATVYQYQNGNALLDDYVKEHELYVCALTKTGTRAESDDYANYAGGMIEITYGSKTITALVADSMQLDTDKNTTRKKGDVDLDPDAFKALTGATTGEFDITWKIVPNTAAENGNVQYRIKEGSNTGWAAVQPRNTVYPVAKLEYKVGSGSYKEAELKEFFHYVIEPGSSAVSFRMTDIFGKEIEEKDVNLGLTGTNSASAAVVDGTVQFPK